VAEGGPTKDQMRLMIRSLLADRFKLAVHTETRQVPVLAFVLAKPGGVLGKPGPQLQPHPADVPCRTGVAPLSAAAPILDAFRQMPRIHARVPRPNAARFERRARSRWAQWKPSCWIAWSIGRRIDPKVNSSNVRYTWLQLSAASFYRW